MGLMPTKNQIRAALRKKKRKGLLPPPECPNPSCRADLRDPGVPEEYALYADLFGLARELPIDPKTAMWMCPVCQHTWGKHEITDPKPGRTKVGG